jgi:hypothetical protein
MNIFESTPEHDASRPHNKNRTKAMALPIITIAFPFAMGLVITLLSDWLFIGEISRIMNINIADYNDSVTQQKESK